jgi:hypothetical protein
VANVENRNGIRKVITDLASDEGLVQAQIIPLFTFSSHADIVGFMRLAGSLPFCIKFLEGTAQSVDNLE